MDGLLFSFYRSVFWIDLPRKTQFRNSSPVDRFSIASRIAATAPSLVLACSGSD
jgi:hypothetical protein